MGRLLLTFIVSFLCAAPCGTISDPYCADRKYGAFTTCSYAYLRYSDRSLRMEIDLPVRNDGDGLCPFVFYVPGGSWRTCGMNAFRRQSAYLASQGIAGVRIVYSLIADGADFRLGLEELQKAYDFVAARAGELGLDTLQFGYVAASAGTPLAADQALSLPACRFFVGYNGIYDLADRIDDVRFPEDDTPYLAPYSDEELRALSPVNRIPQNPPAVALFHGRADRTVSCKQSLLFGERIHAAGGRAEVHIYDDARHGFFNYGMSDYHEEVTRRTAAFIASVLREE